MSRKCPAASSKKIQRLAFLSIFLVDSFKFFHCNIWKLSKYLRISNLRSINSKIKKSTQILERFNFRIRFQCLDRIQLRSFQKPHPVPTKKSGYESNQNNQIWIYNQNTLMGIRPQHLDPIKIPGSDSSALVVCRECRTPRCMRWCSPPSTPTGDPLMAGYSSWHSPYWYPITGKKK